MRILIVFGADPVRVLVGIDVCVTFSCVLELVGGMEPDLHGYNIGHDEDYKDL